MQRSYQERLVQRVRSEVSRAVPAGMKVDGTDVLKKKRNVNISDLSREEAMDYLTEEARSSAMGLKKMQEPSSAAKRSPNEQVHGSGATGATATGEHSNSKKEGYSYKENQDTAQVHKEVTKPKPFGPKKNIHTIDCYRDNSSKVVKAVGNRSNIVGFADKK